MNQYETEEYALGFEDCGCDALTATANDQPCVVCGERVKQMDHTHFKGELYHQWCLMIAALKQASRARGEEQEEG